jgi:hypothetical protein
MTNPYGYYSNQREELLLQDPDEVTLTRKAYFATHKDINRDFPFLVKDKFCMESVGARVVNELFLKNKFILSLSLHGGTESLTYPYGVPNHQFGNPTIEMDYKQGENALKYLGKATKNTMKLVKEYVQGRYDFSLTKKSLNSPDNKAISTLTTSANDHTTSNRKFRYETGDMNTVVYPVRGGMEDWAYSGSWEGAPIIVQPCKPRTYNGYPAEKTTYDNIHSDGMRNIMLLLEVSHSKDPEQKTLGKQNVDCLLNMRKNAFFNTITPHQNTCLDSHIDGYIPRIIRLSLTLIDILEPYINYYGEYKKKSNQFEIKWNVGGSIVVDETYVLYKSFEKIDKSNYTKVKELFEKINDIKQDIKEETKISMLSKVLNQKSKVKSGKGVWNIEYLNNSDPFIFKTNLKNKSQIIFIIVAKVDSYMKDFDNEADPKVPPQTHFVNLRTKEGYVIGDTQQGILLKSKTLFFSDVGNFELN